MKYKRTYFRPEKLSPFNIDAQTVALVPPGSNVLEIGCANGFMGEYLIKNKRCRVTGIEIRINEAYAAKKKLNEVIIGNIEDKKTLRAVRGKYDVILVSALIQHLVNPRKALTEWKRLLKANGLLIITCSNIAHWTIIVSLLKGEFTYEEYGLLDDTHIKFFTPKSFKALIESAGYKIEKYSMDAEGGGYPKISLLGSKLLPHLFTYQMIIAAKK